MDDPAPGGTPPEGGQSSDLPGPTDPAPAEIVDGAAAGGAPTESGATQRSAPGRLPVVVAIVVVVVLVVLGLSFTGLLGSQYDLLAPKSPAGPNSVPFSQAYDAANASVPAQGGGWGLVSVEGFDVPGNGPNPFAHENTSSPCTVGALPTLVHSAPSDATKGLSPYWLFGFESTTNLSLFEVAVVNGQAQVLGTTPPNTSCTGTGRAGDLAPAASIEDSPATVVSLPNLTGFVGAFPNSSFAFFLSDVGGEIGKVSGTAVWLIQGSPCFAPTTAATAPGDPVYIGETNGTSSHVYGDRSVRGYGACEVPGTLGAMLHLNPSVQVLSDFSGGTTYVVGVHSVNGSFPASDFHPQVYASAFLSTSPTEFDPSQLSFSFVNTAGATVMSYNFTTEHWGFGAQVQIVAGESFELNTTGSLEGASLVLIGDTPLTGQIGIYLP